MTIQPSLASRVRCCPRLVTVLGALVAGAYGCRGDGGSAPDAEALTFVGRADCASCHAEESAGWTGSDHDRAMEVPSEASVVGDFDGASFTHRGVTTTFTRSDAGYQVETEGPDGALHRYDVEYTFGFEPLQQYLIGLGGGRMQALSVVWDTRPAEQGGQRWYHLYPDEDLTPADVLHWTGPSQNWNYMCSECHSTGLHKGYDLETDTYDTTWEEIDVSCETCHGPGSAHASWARRRAAGEDAAPSPTPTGAGRYGLTVELGDPNEGAWVMDPATGVAARTAPPPAGQIATCGRCHSRRATLDPEAPPTGELLDTHLPQVLDRDLYYDDGQIRDEVYVWGSFVQSPMYLAGVRCSDCHDPHTLALRAPDNGVCSQCHLPGRFDVPEHHHHEPGTEGARCVSCHMPATTYMGVDERLDHSLRVPRPDVSEEVGSPDACTSCHSGRSAGWAASVVADWYGPDRRRERRYGQVLHAGREGEAGSSQELASLIVDGGTPAIVRATALTILAQRPDPTFAAVLPSALRDPDPQVRTVAARSLDVVPLQGRLQLAGPLLNDPTLAVRTQAARVLAPVPREGMVPGQVRILERATEEYVRTLGASADHPSSHVALARLYADLGQADSAERELRTALRIGPWYVPSWVNLADLYRSLGRDSEGRAVLSEGLERHPDQPSLHYSLGLLLVRAGQIEDALPSLERAAELGPDDSRYAYAYAIALKDAGRADEAVARLDEALERHPNDRDLLFALATLHRDAGRPEEGLRYARRLVELAPDNPAFSQLVDQLRGGGH